MHDVRLSVRIEEIEGPCPRNDGIWRTGTYLTNTGIRRT